MVDARIAPLGRRAGPCVFLRVMGGGLLDRGSTTLRGREIAIDRTCARCGSEYGWGVHMAFFGERVELTPDEVAGTCAADLEATVFAPRERLLLRLVGGLSTTTYSTLSIPELDVHSPQAPAGSLQSAS